ncbi:signal peptide peptidase SppA [Candidatus Woesearchaeota archaeon]|nr:MAG: signal peptide peptidase SppA [Candidatus Woesearchaeota archaeon]
MVKKYTSKVHEKGELPLSKKVWVSLLLLLAFFFVASILASIVSLSDVSVEGSGNVARIKLHGVITVDDGLGTFSPDTIIAEDVVSLLEKADEDASIKAVVLDINSPGGSAVASDEIGRVVRRLNKTVVAVIREVGASGGYWIASNADFVVANRMSITGSIGVTSSYLGFGGFLRDHNVTYNRLVAGKFKDMGSPFRELTDEERALFQEKLDRIHSFFIEEVAQNRNLSLEEVKNLATGEVYLGVEALDAGLVDALGGFEEAEQFLEEELGEDVSFVTFKKKKTFLDVIEQVISGGSFALLHGAVDVPVMRT